MSATVLDQLRATLGDAYAIERELGGGGMSRVFVAEETALGRKVVVKVIAPELMEGVSAERFAREVGCAGDTARTRELIEEFRQRQQEWRSSTAVIRAYSGVRDTTGMLEAMERAVDIKDPFVMSTPLADKLFDPVRGSARFAAVVVRLGLDPARYTAEAVGRSR